MLSCRTNDDTFVCLKYCDSTLENSSPGVITNDSFDGVHDIRWLMLESSSMLYSLCINAAWLAFFPPPPPPDVVAFSFDGAAVPVCAVAELVPAVGGVLLPLPLSSPSVIVATCEQTDKKKNKKKFSGVVMKTVPVTPVRGGAGWDLSFSVRHSYVTTEHKRRTSATALQPTNPS
ncbi:hypothetical protein TRICI_005079 [Trichomonascus ciferrii]|uniref:Uncharacterized protein n=1 Tax=Trichomonascus ciferrii TaxID=44093 RepID=A0A642UWL8_9ASCO|nr:hypothetical protein TRICI_005079 [Trichomonascus ciferrii]